MDRRLFLALLSAALGAKSPASARDALPPLALAGLGDTRCSFCNRRRAETKALLAGPDGTTVCSECIELCLEIIREEDYPPPPAPPFDPTPPVGSSDPTGYFPTYEELCHLTRDQTAILLKARGFGDWEPFDGLVDAAISARDRYDRIQKTANDLAAATREELEDLFRDNGDDEETVQKAVEAVERMRAEQVRERKAAEERPPPALACSFCRKPQAEVRKLIAGPATYICDGCSAFGAGIIAGIHRG